MRILIIEPNLEVVEVLRDALHAEGWEVDSTGSGVEATVRIWDERFDVALLDLETNLLTGERLRRAIRDLRGAAVVVMSSLRSSWRRQAFTVGATACLKKPFDLDALISLLRALEASEGVVDGGLPGDVRQLSRKDLQGLGRLTLTELDMVPFGVIRLDATGRVTAFNAFESECSGYSARQVVGMPFRKLAPCLGGKAFVAAMDEGWARGRLDRQFQFVFPHHSASAMVSVRVYFDSPHRQLWVLVSKRRGEPRQLPPQPEALPWDGEHVQRW